MSIYATLMEIGVKRFGDKEIVHILIQGVPAHIDHVGPMWMFLPPPVDPNGDLMRAVYLVEVGDEKGTARCGQEYVKPLIVLTGREYAEIKFIDLMKRLEEALDLRYGTTPCAIFIDSDGNEKNLS